MLILKSRLLILTLLIATAVIGVSLWSVLQRQPESYRTVVACDVMSASIARAAAGNSAQRSAPQPIRSNQTITTFCNYRTTDRLASLAVRSPRNATGAELNKQAFDEPPVRSQRLNGLGDAAYWTPTLGQLNVLKDNQWYIVSTGPLAVSQRTVAEARQLAERLIK